MEYLNESQKNYYVGSRDIKFANGISYATNKEERGDDLTSGKYYPVRERN